MKITEINKEVLITTTLELTEIELKTIIDNIIDDRYQLYFSKKRELNKMDFYQFKEILLTKSPSNYWETFIQLLNKIIIGMKDG